VKSRIEQVNKALKKVLGEILLREFPDLLPLGVQDVLIDPPLERARVWLRTTAKILAEVEKKRQAIQLEIPKRVKLPRTPKLTFLLDDQYLDNLDQLFEKIEQQDPSS